MSRVLDPPQVDQVPTPDPAFPLVAVINPGQDLPVANLSYISDGQKRPAVTASKVAPHHI